MYTPVNLVTVVNLEVHLMNMGDSEDIHRGMAYDTRGEVDAAVALAGLQYEAEIDQLRTELREAQNDLCDAEDRVFEAEAKIRNAECQAAIAQSRVRNTKTQAEDMQREMIAAGARLASMNQRLSGLDRALYAECLDKNEFHRQAEQWRQRAQEAELQLTQSVAGADRNRAEELEHIGILQCSRRQPQ